MALALKLLGSDPILGTHHPETSWLNALADLNISRISVTFEVFQLPISWLKALASLNIPFYSATYRLFNIPELEDACEDHGQAVIYRGSIDQAPTRLVFDQPHNIEAGKVFPVCGNTYRMLHQTRFAPHFQFIGDFERHYGLFEGCGSAIPFDQDRAASGAAASCC